MITTLLLLTLGVRVELPSEARVRGAEISLGAVAQVSGADGLEVERVRAVSLGYAPAPGYSRLLQAERILRDIQSQAPGITVTFAGAAATRVWPEVKTLSGSVIEAAARAELTRHLAGRDATLELAQPVADLTVPLGGQPADLRARLASTHVRPGQVSVPVQISVDGAVWRNVVTSWRLQEWQVRPVLVREVAAGQTISPDMLEERRVPVERGDTLLAGYLIGSKLARTTPAGRALHPDDLQHEVLVHTGAVVFLEIRKGGVTARVPATAEDDGARGDTIGVRLASGGRTLRASVVGRDSVRIDMGTGSQIR